MQRIGLISDTHDDVVPFDTIAGQVADAFAGVELILHCGDLTTTGILEQLCEIAPVLAVRSSADPPPAPPRLVDGPRVIDAAEMTIGLVNTLVDDPATTFDREVDVVVHGGTHEASVEQRGRLLLVNPGSPTLANERTVAVLDLGGPSPRATIVRL
jgi:hypothetical protein